MKLPPPPREPEDRDSPQPASPGQESWQPAIGGPDLSSYSEEAEIAPPSFWKRVATGRAWKVIAAAVVLVVILVLVFPPVYREAKARRALAILAAAEEEMKHGGMAAAREKFQTGFSMAPGDPRVIRILTRYNATAGDPASLRTMTNWLEAGSATPVECLALAGVAINRKNSALAKKALDALPENLPPELDAIRFLTTANLLANEDRLSEAAGVLRTASLPEPQMRRIRLVLGTLLLRASPETVEEGRRVLENLGEGDDDEGLSALRQLAAFQLSTGRQQGNERLLSHPLHTYSDLLLCTQILLGQPDADREKIIGGLIADAPSLDIKDRVALARWLLTLQSPDLVPGLFSREELTSSEAALLTVADALAAQGRWKEIREFLVAEKRPPLDEAIRQLFLARISQQLGDEDAAETHWKAIRQEMDLSSTETIRLVAGYALQSGQTERAHRTFQFLAERKDATPEDFVNLIRSAPRNAPAAQTLALFDAFQAAYPNISEMRSDRAYLSLLAGRDIEACSATAKELSEKNPEYLSYLSVLALAELRRGRPADADRLYDGRSISWNEAHSNFKVVRIAVLEANGRSAEAEALRSTLNPAALRPEESDLIKIRR